jgi:hypothetical protein
MNARLSRVLQGFSHYKGQFGLSSLTVNQLKAKFGNSDRQPVHGEKKLEEIREDRFLLKLLQF